MPDPTPVTEFKYEEAKRKHIPPAGAMASGRVAEEQKIKYAYDPHRTPELRFNEEIQRCRELLARAQRTTLTAEETAELARFLESPQPWLEWAGKREQAHFEVDPVALHIHERVAAQAVLKMARREDVQRDMFAQPNLGAKEARAYYQYDVDWANRLITGDSLQVMTSLARREGLAGQVQMIYLDPPYGIKFSSNWQNELGKRDVKDKDEDLTREPEMIKAYRDTWTLGVHSYLAYLKQRFIVARDLLAASGSIFVQISDENLHRVRVVMDEVFGAENACGMFTVQKTGGLTQSLVPGTSDFLLWYARDASNLKFRPLYLEKTPETVAGYTYIELPSGLQTSIGAAESAHLDLRDGRVYQPTSVESANPRFEFNFRAATYNHRWKTNQEGLRRLSGAERFHQTTNTLRYVRYVADFPVIPLTSVWTDTGSGSFLDEQLYVVQTVTKVIARCLLMTTDPGDLVLDPTCGSGTTAFVAEQWGRRWITIDSSRVAVAIARQRLLTACFDTYKTKDPNSGVDPNLPMDPKCGFIYKTVPHITLKSIAQNKGLDPIFAKHEPILTERLKALNREVLKITENLREKLVGKLLAKAKDEGYRAVTEADERRWILPGVDPKLFQQTKGGLTAKQTAELRAFAATMEKDWKEWQVPFDAAPEWPKPLQEALTAYRQAWRSKMDEVNKAIEASAEQEELVDQPEAVRGVVRVSGPFTVESVRPPEDSLKGQDISPIGGEPEALETFDAPEKLEAANAASHIDRMLSLLREDGITFLGNKFVKLSRVDRIESSFLHAEGEFTSEDGQEHRVAIAIGPEHGSVPAFQVEETMRLAHRRGYDDLVIAGFSFDAGAQRYIQEHNDDPATKLRIHMAQIRPDVTMGDLLKKTQVSAQIFTVFGQPRTKVEEMSDGEVRVHMQGVDIYDPVKNSIDATNAGKIAAWFLDTDYDGQTFCICQAFFPDKDAWKKIARALKSDVEDGAFEALSRTTSLPFKPGPRKSVAVKVIDPRGNEVMRVHRLGSVKYGED